MEAPLTQRAFEEALVRQCAPTLAGLKPASLFTFVGTFALPRCERHSDEVENGSAAAPIELDAWTAVRDRRDALLGIAEACERALRPQGIRIRILVWRACGALVYVYRPAMLRASIQERRVRQELEARGYDVLDLDACLETLGQWVAACSCEHGHGDKSGWEMASRPCPTGERTIRERLPHEIGFFLGYPFEDVMGFIEHDGRDFICFGCWKVYANPRRAVESWTSYRRCTERYRALHASGTPLIELAASRLPRTHAAQARA